MRRKVANCGTGCAAVSRSFGAGRQDLGGSAQRLQPTSTARAKALAKALPGTPDGKCCEPLQGLTHRRCLRTYLQFLPVVEIGSAHPTDLQGFVRWHVDCDL